MQLCSRTVLIAVAFLVIASCAVVMAQPINDAAALRAMQGLTDSDLRQALDDAGVTYGEAANRAELVRLLQQHERASIAGEKVVAADRAGRGRGHVLRALVCVG